MMDKYRLIPIICSNFSVDPALPVISPDVAEPKEFAGLAHQSSPTTDDKDIDAAVSSIISAKFAEVFIMTWVKFIL